MFKTIENIYKYRKLFGKELLRTTNRPLPCTFSTMLQTITTCCSEPTTDRQFIDKRIRKRVFKQAKRDFIALNKLLIKPPSSFAMNAASRFFHTTPYSNQNVPNDKKNQDKNDDKKDDDDGDSKTNMIYKLGIWLLSSYVVITLMSLLLPRSNQPDHMRYVSWSEFVHHMLAKGEVEELTVVPDLNMVTIFLQDNAVIKGKKVDFKTFHMNITDVEKFEEKLRQAEASLGIPIEKGVPVVYERSQEGTWMLLFSLVVVAFIILRMVRSGQIKSDMKVDIFSHLTKAKFTVVDPLTGGGKGVLFKDVAGLQEAKLEVMEFVDYLKTPEKYKVLGAKVPKGVLLLGPPGCGKTMLAKAVATEANVPFLAMAGSEFIEMIGGLGAARVRDLFNEAKKRSPCIIYIDEIDAIGRRRGGGNVQGKGEEEQTLNQLLVELDGMATKEEVIMLASTNRADMLDKALLRPGRFDRHILIDLPTLAERKEIFELHLDTIRLENKPQDYSARMAQLTPGFSGADIANVCNEAALHAARHKQAIVKGENLEYAVERVVGGTEKRSQVMSPEEKTIIAYHECGHALVGWMLEHTDALLKVSIVPRTTNVLGFAQYVPTDKKLYTTDQLFDRMCMALGGRVAESLTFNRITTGAQDDLKKVTNMAYAQIKQYGMNPVVGHLSFPIEDNETGIGKKPFSRRLANTMDEQARLLVASAYKKTESVLLANKDKLEKLSASLLKHEVLNYSDIEALIGPSPFGKKQGIETIDWGPVEGRAQTPLPTPETSQT